MKGDAILIENPNDSTLWERVEPTWSTFVENMASSDFNLVIRDPVFLVLCGVFALVCLLRKSYIALIVVALGLGMWGAAGYAVGLESLAGQIGVIVGASIVAMVVAIYYFFVRN